MIITETVIWTLNRLVPIEVHFMEKNPGMFSSKTLTWKTWVSKLSAKGFFYFFFLSELL